GGQDDFVALVGESASARDGSECEEKGVLECVLRRVSPVRNLKRRDRWTPPSGMLGKGSASSSSGSVGCSCRMGLGSDRNRDSRSRSAIAGGSFAVSGGSAERREGREGGGGCEGAGRLGACCRASFLAALSKSNSMQNNKRKKKKIADKRDRVFGFSS